ncbi:MAG: alginate O-acetyltransferase complex protein AlgI, partial [Myxococcota bacterium]
MSFVQAEFLLFFAVVWALYWSPLGRRGQNAVLVLASSVFYGWVHPAWVVLLYSSAGVDFAMGQLMVRSPKFKRVWLGLSLLTNLGLLFWFKYFDFFLGNVVTALTALGIPAHAGTLGLLLPAGLSFYTFQTMSYTLDIYRGELKPRTSLLDYLAFVSFFPQLVAGPIERAARLLPQLEVARRFRWSNLRDGFGLALWGAFKKVAIADTLAPYVDKAFLLDDPAGPVVWAATTGFMLQLYADFSGYTDLA